MTHSQESEPVRCECESVNQVCTLTVIVLSNSMATVEEGEIEQNELRMRLVSICFRVCVDASLHVILTNRRNAQVDAEE